MYLGVTFSQNLRNVQHIDSIIRKVRATIACLRPLLRNQRGLSSRVKLICYKQLIRSQMCYGFVSWSDISSAQMERLRLPQRGTEIHQQHEPTTKGQHREDRQRADRTSPQIPEQAPRLPRHAEMPQRISDECRHHHDALYTAMAPKTPGQQQ